jgi:uncharacterized repeat protein (TIGR01451 family)
MTQTKAPWNKKAIAIRLAAAAFLVAGVATTAKLMRPSSNASDLPLAADSEASAKSEAATDAAARSDAKSPADVLENSAKNDAAPAPLNPFDTSAVANAFSSKPNSFEQPAPFKPAADVQPIQRVQHEEPLDTIPPVAEVAPDDSASPLPKNPLPKNPFGNNAEAPAVLDAAEDEAAETAPPNNFGAANEAAPPVEFKPQPKFGQSDAPANAFDSRELPSKETGTLNNDDPPRAFDSDRSANAYVEPRPLSEPVREGAEGNGVPGTTKLEGVQTPSLTVEKIAPDEIQVGKPTTFEVIVTNTSHVTAHDVRLRDEIPRGTKLIGTTPRAEQTTDAGVEWALGDLGPDQQATVKMQLMPTAEGEIGSVATVEFAARASAKTIATKPELELTVSSPGKVMKDEKVVMAIRISNTGSGAARGIVIHNAVPPQLSHETGRELEYDVGTLEPGKSRELELVLDAAKAGQVSSLLTARCDGPARAEARAEFEVIAPELEVGVDGPSRRYLEREASYTLSVHNPGTATAKDISLVSYLPDGMKFVEADHLGKYDPEEHSVRWSLEELPPKELGTVKMTAVPIQEGDLKLRVEGTALQGLKSEKEQSIAVEGIAAIKFQVADVEDPVEVGGETTYEIRIVNQGSKAARDVRVAAVVPPEMKPLSATGPSRYAIEGSRVVFEPLALLAPKADTSFTVKVQAIQAGDLRLSVLVLTDDSREPVTKEESTRVYADE